MKLTRTLSLTAERLTELTPGELGAVNGGASIRTVCLSGLMCDPSRIAASICCATEYCN